MNDSAVEIALNKLCDINEADYKVLRVSIDKTLEKVVFYILVSLTESGRRGFITINVSSRAAYSSLFQLYDFLLEELRNGVDMLIKKLS